jgi:predicted RNase H-like HicB family nuclease
MNINHYTYRVTWSAEDNEHVGLCKEFPLLSWHAASPEKALSGIRLVVGEVVAEMTAFGEPIPEALAEKN